MAFCCGLLLCPSVMAFWFGGLLIEGGLLVESGLLLWLSGMAFWYGFWCGGLLLWPSGWKVGTPEDHTRRLPSIRKPQTRRPPNQKAITEGHTPQIRHPPWEQMIPWKQTPREQTPPCEQNSWHTPMKILPCTKLCLRVVKGVYWCSILSQYDQISYGGGIRIQVE